MEFVELIIAVGSFVLLMSLGLTFGRLNERRHIRSLDEREFGTSDMLLTQVKSFPHAAVGDAPPCLLVAEVVIASDYLKGFLAGLRNIFGGEVRSYQTMLTRARRETTMRLLEQAQRLGYNAVCNLRLETADVGGSAVARRNAMVAVIGSGTAYHAHVRSYE